MATKTQVVPATIPRMEILAGGSPAPCAAESSPPDPPVSEQLESELRRSEERHRLLAENAWDVVWTMALDGSITYVSPGVLRMRGFTPAEAMAQTIDEIHPPATAASVAEYYAKLFAAIAAGTEPPIFRGEHEYYRRDGSIMTGELQVIPHVDSDGQVVEILGVTRDISERKQIEAANARYHKLIDNSVVATGLMAPDGGFVLVNPAMCTFSGYDREVLITMNWQDLMVLNGAANPAAVVADLLAGVRDSYRTTRRYRRADGGLVWADESLSCVWGEDGELEHLVVQIVDTTAEVKARGQLVRQERRNHALAERLRAELNSAAHYIASILPDDLTGSVRITSSYIPALEVGGDCFDYTWLDGENLIFYLLDVSGHGVAPALLAVSVQSLLRSGSLPKHTLLTPDKVLLELNDVFRMERHGGNYFTIWYGAYHAPSRTVRYAGAGHPPPIAFTGGHPTQLTSQSPPIGFFTETEFITTAFAVPRDCQILLYTDGASELPLADGRPGTQTEFVELCTDVAKSPNWSLDELLKRLQQRSRSRVFEDDCALIRLQFD